jgi:hypothetical protein
VSYELSPDQAELLRKPFLKGLGAVVLLVPLAAALGWAVREAWGPQAGIAGEGLGIFAILFIVQRYSKQVATVRLEIARRSRRKSPETVYAALFPYLEGKWVNVRTRFDSSGEAHFLLAEAAANLGEEETFRRAVGFLLRFRRGEWAERAAKLKPPT